MSGRRPILEVCIDSLDGFHLAMLGGADRVEACSALEIGGLTPTPGMLGPVGGGPTPAVAMIRPRAGPFAWDQFELGLMMAEIDAAREAGFAGIAIGAVAPGDVLDLDVLGTLVRYAGNLEVTLHRAFDLVRDPFEALEQAVGLGIRRILTSGAAPTAVEGLDRIAALDRAARGRIVVMPGGGITAENVSRIMAAAQFEEVHASCSEHVRQDPWAMQLGLAPPIRRETRLGLVQALRGALDSERQLF